MDNSNEKKRYTRMTNQRLVILEHLQETNKHPTADELYQKIKSKLPKISKATVYRNLKVLKKQGAIQKLNIEDEARWEAASSPHHHFICQKCGRIIEVSLADIWQIEERIEDKYDVKVDNYQINIKGVCDFCLKH